MAIEVDGPSSVGRGRVVSGLVGEARERVTAAAGVPVLSLEDAELGRLLAGLTGLEAQAAALRLEVLAERSGGRWRPGRAWPIPRLGHQPGLRLRALLALTWAGIFSAARWRRRRSAPRRRPG